MRKSIHKLINCFLLFTLLLLLPVQYIAANDYSVYTNADTGYVADIKDDASLLTDSEKNELLAYLQPVTDYANVAFLTTDQNPYSDAYSYAYYYYEEYYGYSDGIIVLIDMDNREILIHGGEKMEHIITDDYADTITDNVYRYASNGDYFTCAYKAFDQIYSLLEGQRIAQPMKYICNALLAIIAALLINYLIAKSCSASKKASAGEIATGIKSNFAFRNPSVVLTRTEKHYTPRQSSSSSGGHSSGGGSHSSHSSGGHSGSSGSHRF